ncbi:MAG: response regulator transcription factor [Anaerolineae bacterium]|nr:response regulator transcription factor [Anaerolineae bacterium]
MKVLIVEDDLVLMDVLSFTLRREGYEVVHAQDGKTALEQFDTENPTIVLLDLNLPQLDGLSVCRHIRQKHDTPIIILSVRDSDEEVIEGLRMGADDYMTKPFSPAQLTARMETVLRRVGQSAPRKLSLGTATLDPERHLLEQVDADPIQFSPLEYSLIELLMINGERVLPTQTIIDRIWPGGGDKAMLKQLVYRLRQKIEACDIYIDSVPGVGYALVQRKR